MTGLTRTIAPTMGQDPRLIGRAICSWHSKATNTKVNSSMALAESNKSNAGGVGGEGVEAGGEVVLREVQ